MNTIDFNYDLPEELIAQQPLEKRDASRMMVVSRTSGDISHEYFHQLLRFLRRGDRLIFNNTKVFPARLICKKEGMETPVELLFTKKIDKTTWEVIGRPVKRLRQGIVIHPEMDLSVTLTIKNTLDDGIRIVTLTEGSFQSIEELLYRWGSIPLPPYIKRKPDDHDRSAYQTVYAQHQGAIAAPTAGLHFTSDFLATLVAEGIAISFLTLHVGIGTFRPVKTDDPALHSMHAEEYELSAETADAIMQTKKSGGRIIAVGTTSVRVLEHCATGPDTIMPGIGSTRLLILPGYRFKIIDGLITNFHLPQSTLLMLVCAFAGMESVLNAYHQAVQNRYRFFSYGDAMLII